MSTTLDDLRAAEKVAQRKLSELRSAVAKAKTVGVELDVASMSYEAMLAAVRSLGACWESIGGALAGVTLGAQAGGALAQAQEQGRVIQYQFARIVATMPTGGVVALPATVSAPTAAQIASFVTDLDPRLPSPSVTPTTEMRAAAKALVTICDGLAPALSRL